LGIHTIEEERKEEERKRKRRIREKRTRRKRKGKEEGGRSWEPVQFLGPTLISMPLRKSLFSNLYSRLS
jgi:hypothetical protein